MHPLCSQFLLSILLINIYFSLIWGVVNFLCFCKLSFKFCLFSSFQEKRQRWKPQFTVYLLIYLLCLSCVFPWLANFLSIFHVESFCLVFSIFSFSSSLCFPLLNLFPLPPYLVEYLLSSTLCSLSLPPSLLCTQLLRFNRSYC